MALQHQQILCGGNLVWALDQADGTHRCECGDIVKVVLTDLVRDRAFFRPSERVLAGFDPDHRAEALEERGKALSVVDFDSPFKDAA